MANKDVAVKKYVERLSTEERAELEVAIRKGKSPAQRLLKARILLKADVSEAGEGWSDSKIIKALDTSPSMVYRVRKQLVEEGFAAVLRRKQRATPCRAADFRRRKGSQADRFGLFQTAQGTRPLDLAALGEEGCRTRHRRSCQRLNDRSRFKKTLSNPIAGSNGSSRPRPTPPSSQPWKTCSASTRGHAILIARWCAWTKPRSN
jgi:hypothetical protein